MKFLKENDTYFAIIQNDVYNGLMCEEIMYAEIEKSSKGWLVRWEDKFNEPHPFQELADAQQYVLLQYHKHTPFINGKSWKVDEE